MKGTCNPPPSPNRRRNPSKSAEQIGGPIFQHNRFPVPWISVRPKHTFLSVALQLESCGNPKYISIFKKKFYCLRQCTSKRG